MNLIEEREINQNIIEKFDYKFQIFQAGFYLVEIKARAKSWFQNTLKLISFLKDDDLAVKIDDWDFLKLSKKRGLFDSEVAWNGNRLKNLQQINIFSIYLEKGEHRLSFLADQSPYLETIKIYQVQNEKEIIFEPGKEYQIEDGNRRPWLNFILVNLALKKLLVKAKANSKNNDDDDLQLKIDGQIQINETPKSHKYWHWCGRTLRGCSKIFEKELNLPQGTHYLEFWADRMPELEKLMIGVEEILKEAVASGQIAVYEDVIAGVKEANLRVQPDEESDILTKITNGEKIVILEKMVLGSRPKGFLSDLWHKALYKGERGFVHSSLIEIKGQERERIIEKIKTKAQELSIDEKLALNLSHCESKWLPFARSLTDNKGIYQLGEYTIKDINEKYSGKISDPYDAEQNIDGGLRYFRHLLDKYNGSSDYLKRVITAWSRGSTRITYEEPFIFKKQPEETQKLIRCVLEEKQGEKWLKILGLLLFISLLGLMIFSLVVGKGEKKAEYRQRERSVYMSQDYVASFFERASKEEVALTDFEDDFDNDGIFEKVTFGFISPESFHYITRVYSPNNKIIDIYGIFSKAETRDFNNDGVKELVLSTISGRMFNFFVFAYKKGGLRLLPTYNQSSDIYDGIWARAPIEFQDVNNDGRAELLAKTEVYPGGDWRDWYEIIEYYRWKDFGFEKYQEEKNHLLINNR